MRAGAFVHAPAAERPPKAPGSWLRGRWRAPVALVTVFLALLFCDTLLYKVTLPVAISSDGARLTYTVGGVSQRAPISGTIIAVTVPARDPVMHEYQIDGTDSTNTLTLDPAYLHSIATTPYYRFYAWMRDLDGLSRWRDLCVSATTSGAPRCIAQPPLSGAALALPQAGATQRTQRITARVQRPETPVALALTMSDTSVVTITINRNDRSVILTRALDGLPPQVVSQDFFPTDTAPFAAMTADFVARVTLWALALLALVCGGEMLLGLAFGALGLSGARAETPQTTAGVRIAAAGWVRKPPGWLAARLRALTAAIHPIGLLALAASFGFVVWIALAQYHAQPHIYDASAYLFSAKTFADGRLWAPAPPSAVAQDFPGPFMTTQGGKWFSQYEPGASLTLALGVKLGAPWLVEPLLGTLALLGVGLIARRLFDRRVATLAVLLGAISPFYSYLAASYLSHTIALFYLVWGCWALLRWLADERRRGAGWYLPLTGLMWLMAALTRETSIIFAVVMTGGALWLGWRDDWPMLRDTEWRRWLAPGLALLGIGALGIGFYFIYNATLTGNPLITPREMFFSGDRYGFGSGIGFYGQHTLAAGFVNLDELLTSLAIDLYGWPFYLTLAFLLIPFLTRRAVAADVVMLVGAAAMTLAFVGYFYHGIYLGPRYLFEALPFFLILTARGLETLTTSGRAARALGVTLGAAHAVHAAEPSARPLPAPGRSISGALGSISLTGALALALLACWSLFYLPRQVTLHTDFTGLGVGTVLKTGMFDHPPLRNALVVTGDNQLYGYMLFGLNDPLLRGNVIYAEATSGADYARLQRAFPGRSLYTLIVDANGTAHFIPQPDIAQAGR